MLIFVELVTSVTSSNNVILVEYVEKLQMNTFILNP